MPFYLTRFSYTPETWATLIKHPEDRRTLREATVTPPPRYGSSRVRRLREGLGLSQPVFAKALNVSVGTVRSWEPGARIPDGPSRRLLEVVERHSNAILQAVRDTHRSVSTAA